METKTPIIKSSKRDRKETKSGASDSSPEDSSKRERKSSPDYKPSISAMEELIKQFSAMVSKMDKIQTDITAIRNEASQRNKDFEELKNMLLEDRSKRMKEISEVKSEIGGVTQSVETVKVDMEKLRAENSNMRTRMVYMEREARKLNIVVSGIDFDSPNDGYEKLQKLIDEKAKDEIKITGLRTFRTRTDAKMMVAVCLNQEEKSKLIAMKKSLVMKEGEGTKPVFINCDLPREDRETQRLLRVLAKQKREKGCDVKLAGNKMKIDGKWFRVNG